MPTASCAGWKTACRCWPTRRPTRCPRRPGTACAWPWGWAIPAGSRCRTSWHAGASRCRPSLMRCWCRSVARPPPTRWKATGARCRRAAMRRCWRRPVSPMPRAAMRRCATSPAVAGCARCPMPRACAWTGWCRPCLARRRPRPGPRWRSSACSTCCRRSCAGPATWPCWTNSPAPWRGWSTCWRAAPSWPNASPTTRCCWTNCSTPVWPGRCRVPGRCWRPARRPWPARTMIRKWRCVRSTKYARH